jgi:hypothetical protein
MDEIYRLSLIEKKNENSQKQKNETNGVILAFMKK